MKMFEVNSVTEMPMIENLPSQKASTETRNPKNRTRIKANLDVKSKGFPELLEVLNDWTPSDSKASRDLLVSDLQTLLESKRYTCMNACIPPLIVHGTYPIEIMHYDSANDVDEFITRMLWMHRVFKSSIGFLIGIPDNQTANEIEEMCHSTLSMDQDCAIVLL
jgi:hypothetical protein